eukprot:358031-Chlamydomonas_euryale.AAC.8
MCSGGSPELPEGPPAVRCEARKIAPARNKPSHKAFLGDEQEAFDCPGGRYETGRRVVPGTAAAARNAATQRPRAAPGSSDNTDGWSACDPGSRISSGRWACGFARLLCQPGNAHPMGAVACAPTPMQPTPMQAATYLLTRRMGIQISIACVAACSPNPHSPNHRMSVAVRSSCLAAAIVPTASAAAALLLQLYRLRQQQLPCCCNCTNSLAAAIVPTASAAAALLLQLYQQPCCCNCTNRVSSSCLAAAELVPGAASGLDAMCNACCSCCSNCRRSCWAGTAAIAAVFTAAANTAGIFFLLKLRASYPFILSKFSTNTAAIAAAVAVAIGIEGLPKSVLAQLLPMLWPRPEAALLAPERVSTRCCASMPRCSPHHAVPHSIRFPHFLMCHHTILCCTPTPRSGHTPTPRSGHTPCCALPPHAHA